MYVRATMPNSISYSYASQLADQMRAVFKRHPEVTTVISQLGRPDDGSDPTSYFNCEFIVGLKPFDEWPRGRVKDDLIKGSIDELQRIPGVVYSSRKRFRTTLKRRCRASRAKTRSSFSATISKS